MRILAIVFSLFSLAAVATPDAKTPVSSEPAPVDEKVVRLVKDNLNKISLTASDVTFSKADGLLEVLTERGLFYFTENGEYLVHGKVYDLANGVENITELSLAKVRVDGMKEFEDSMIVFKAKEEKFKVTVFTDTSCGYCRKLHSQMQTYNDLGITVRYMAFPRSGVGGPTFKELTSIWCAVDQQTAMTNAKMGDNTPAPQAKMCTMPIAEQYTMGMKVGVNGTPAIILDDGTMIPGYQEPAQLFAVLDQ